MSVKDAMNAISTTEFKWWLAYDRIYPIGRERFDYLFSMLALVVSAPNSKNKLTIDDFMPKWGVKKTDNIEALFMSFAKAHNEAIKK